jgi:hypothetical protein
MPDRAGLDRPLLLQVQFVWIEVTWPCDGPGPNKSLSQNQCDPMNATVERHGWNGGRLSAMPFEVNSALQSVGEL